MFLTVYLSNNEQHFTEVPVTPETTCRDLVDLCKEPGEGECHLAEVWRGSGTSVLCVGSVPAVPVAREGRGVFTQSHRFCSPSICAVTRNRDTAVSNAKGLGRVAEGREGDTWRFFRLCFRRSWWPLDRLASPWFLLGLGTCGAGSGRNLTAASQAPLLCGL